MTLTHYTPNPFTLDRTRTYDQSDMTPNGKPRGLWLSDDQDLGWADWCRDNRYETGRLAVKTQFRLSDQAKVRMLRDADAIRAFHAEFRGRPDMPEHLRLRDHFIDWPTVAGLYDGILITPYQWELRLDLDLIWYCGWDCASACIWNIDALVETGERS